MKKTIFMQTRDIENLLISMTVLIACFLFSITIMFVADGSKIKQKYYSKDKKNHFVEMFNIEEPNISTEALLSWVSIAATSALSLDFVNYKKQLNDLVCYFTKPGYKKFFSSHKKKFVDPILKDKLIATAVVSGTPVLLQEGSDGKNYGWKIQVPLLVAYQGSSENSTNSNYIVSVIVVRMPNQDTTAGIGIAQFIVTETMGK